MVFAAEDPGEVVGGVISDDFRNLADLDVRIDEVVDGVPHAEAADQVCEVAAGVLLDEAAEMGLAVVEEFRQGLQSQGLVVVLDVLENQGEVGVPLVIIITDGLRVAPEKLREKEVYIGDGAGRGIGVRLLALNQKTAAVIDELFVASGVEEEVICLVAAAP